MQNLTLKVDNLVKKFGPNNIINGIDFEYLSGKMYGIIGENGSGKSVYLKLLLNLYKPTSGKVSYLSGSKEICPKIGAVIDGTTLNPDLTAYENLKYLSSFRKEIGKNEIIKVLNTVGLDSKNKKPIRRYSIGMNKRLLLAQAIMENPDILILDEPTNGLDAEGISLYRRIISQYKEMGKLIICVSHTGEALDDLCDDIHKMKDGLLI